MSSSGSLAAVHFYCDATIYWPGNCFATLHTSNRVLSFFGDRRREAPVLEANRHVPVSEGTRAHGPKIHTHKQARRELQLPRGAYVGNQYASDLDTHSPNLSCTYCCLVSTCAPPGVGSATTNRPAVAPVCFTPCSFPRSTAPPAKSHYIG